MVFVRRFNFLVLLDNHLINLLRAVLLHLHNVLLQLRLAVLVLNLILQLCLNLLNRTLLLRVKRPGSRILRPKVSLHVGLPFLF
jgi:hypothetical protein